MTSRDRILSVRFTDAGYERIAAEAAADRITPSEWVRRTVAREMRLLAEIRRIRSPRSGVSGVSVGNAVEINWTAL
jgi:hypothetical protein